MDRGFDRLGGDRGGELVERHEGVVAADSASDAPEIVLIDDHAEAPQCGWGVVDRAFVGVIGIDEPRRRERPRGADARGNREPLLAEPVGDEASHERVESIVSRRSRRRRDKGDTDCAVLAVGTRDDSDLWKL